MTDGPTAKPRDVRQLSIALSDGKWHLGRELAEVIDARTIRAVCAAHPDEFISTQAGFKMLRYASQEPNLEPTCTVRTGLIRGFETPNGMLSFD